MQCYPHTEEVVSGSLRSLTAQQPVSTRPVQARALQLEFVNDFVAWLDPSLSLALARGMLVEITYFSCSPKGCERNKTPSRASMPTYN
jgi:hypothetical protein